MTPLKADPEGGTGGPDPPLKNHNNIGFLCNTGPDPLYNYKATKPAFNVVPSSARQLNTIKMGFPWRADDGPFIAVFWSYILSSTKKDKKTRTPLNPRMPLVCTMDHHRVVVSINSQCWLVYG